MAQFVCWIIRLISIGLLLTEAEHKILPVVSLGDFGRRFLPFVSLISCQSEPVFKSSMEVFERGSTV